MQSSLLDQGFDLMIFGMGTVFVFLTLLVFCTFFMSAFISRFLSEPDLPAPSAPASNVTNQTVAPETLAVLQAAIKAHKQQ